MRRWQIATAVGISALALSGVAVATDQFGQVSDITLTGTHAGQSTGIKAHVYSWDPGALGQKPKAAKTLTVTLPKGTKFNLGSVKKCTLSDKQLELPGGPQCPAASKIGTGSAVANAAPSPLTKITAKVTSYVHSASDIILWVTSSVSTPIVIHEAISHNTLTIPVPTQTIGSGANKIVVVLTGLTLNVPEKGSGANALIKAGKCTAGKFDVKSHFKYVDGSTFDTSSSSKCK